MKLNTSVALKAGLIGAAAGVVIALLVNVLVSVFAPLACIVCWLPFVIGLATGALYVQFSSEKVEITEGAVGGAVAGVISSLGGVIVNIIWAAVTGGDIFTNLSGLVGGAVLGAIGGLIWSAIKGRK